MKKHYNYRRALNAPYYVQKLWKNFSLENPFLLEKGVVWLISLLFLLTVGRPFMDRLGHIQGLRVATYILLPFCMVIVWEKVEPDGKKIHHFILDYVVYLLLYRLRHVKVSQGKRVRSTQERSAFEKVTIYLKGGRQ